MGFNVMYMLAWCHECHYLHCYSQACLFTRPRMFPIDIDDHRSDQPMGLNADGDNAACVHGVLMNIGKYVHRVKKRLSQPGNAGSDPDDIRTWAPFPVIV